MADQPELPFDRIPERIRAQSETHNAQLRRLDKRSRDAVARRLERAAERVKSKIDELPEGSWRRHRARNVQYIARLTDYLTSREVERVSATAVDGAFDLAPAQVEEELRAWGEHYGADFRPPNLRAIAELSDEILIQRIPASLENWGPETARAIQEELSVSVAGQAPTGEIRDAVERIIGDRRYKAERIVRTELQESYNAAHHESLRYGNRLAPEGEAPVKKTAIATFDARTDQDSFPVHGQVRELDEDFVDGDGREYLHPPGRPNDREKEVPWLERRGAEIMSREEGIEESQRAQEALEGTRRSLRDRVRERIGEFSDAGEGELLRRRAVKQTLAEIVPSKEIMLTTAGAAAVLGAGYLAVKSGAAGAALTAASKAVRAVQQSATVATVKAHLVSLIQRLAGFKSRSTAFRAASTLTDDLATSTLSMTKNKAGVWVVDDVAEKTAKVTGSRSAAALPPGDTAGVFEELLFDNVTEREAVGVVSRSAGREFSGGLT